MSTVFIETIDSQFFEEKQQNLDDIESKEKDIENLESFSIISKKLDDLKVILDKINELLEKSNVAKNKKERKMDDRCMYTNSKGKRCGSYIYKKSDKLCFTHYTMVKDQSPIKDHHFFVKKIKK